MNDNRKSGILNEFRSTLWTGDLYLSLSPGDTDLLAAGRTFIDMVSFHIYKTVLRFADLQRRL